MIRAHITPVTAAQAFAANESAQQQCERASHKDQRAGVTSDHEENAFEDDEEEESPRPLMQARQTNKTADDRDLRYSSHLTPGEVPSPPELNIAQQAEPASTRGLIDYFRSSRPPPLPINCETANNDNSAVRRPGEAAVDQINLPKRKSSSCKELGPIPLDFSLPLHQLASYSGDQRILYVGPRPCNSAQLHMKYANLPGAYRFQAMPGEVLLESMLERNQHLPSSHRPLANNNFNPQGQPYRLFSGMNPSTPNELQFDSDFECGNLDLVIRLPLLRREPLPTYDLFMRPDSNAKRPTQQWFCFAVRNTKKDATVRFNIVNFAKKDSLFSQGMRVSIFSVRRNERFRTAWFRGGTILKYGPSKVSRAASPSFRSPRPPPTSHVKHASNTSSVLNSDLLHICDPPSTPPPLELYRETQPPDNYEVSHAASPSKVQADTGDVSIGATGVLYGGMKAQSSSSADDQLGLLSRVGPIEQTRRRNYYQLSFEYTFEYDNDVVYFSYAIPYSFSMVTQQIARMAEECETYGHVSSRLKHGRVVMKTPFSIPETLKPQGGHGQRSQILKVDSICRTLSGVEVPLLTITDFAAPAQNNQPPPSPLSVGGGKKWRVTPKSGEQDKRPVLFLAARIHSSESHASWVLHGFLEAVLGNSKMAEELRRRFVLKVIPMCNVDGVVAGNNRTSLIGKDLNRRYQLPNEKMHPVNYHIKKEVGRLQEAKRVLGFFDIHSHSRRKCTFLYGPRFPLHSPFYLGIRAIPKLMAEQSPAFRYYSCKFKNERKKQGSARLSMWRDLGVNLSYTLETSFLGYLNQERATLQFSIPALLKLGKDLARTILDYALIKERTARTRQTKKAPPSPQQAPSKPSPSQLVRVHYNLPPKRADSLRSSFSEERGGGTVSTLNNLTAIGEDPTKQEKLNGWMSFLKEGGDPAVFLDEPEIKLKPQEVVRVPSLPFGVGVVDDEGEGVSDLDAIEAELDAEEHSTKGRRCARTMRDLLEGVIHDRERVLRYKARKDGRRGNDEEDEGGFDSEEFDEEELASSSDENQEREASDLSGSEDDFEQLLKQAIEESRAQHDESEPGVVVEEVAREEEVEEPNNRRTVLMPEQFYPPQHPSSIYLNMPMNESSREPVRATGRWGVKVREETKRCKVARPQIHVRNLFEECFDDRHVIETKNRWPKSAIKPKLFKVAGMARNRHTRAIKEAGAVSLSRPQTQYERFSQNTSELITSGDISLPRHQYIAASKAAASRVGNILQSSDIPQSLSSYFSDMLVSQAKVRKESGAYAIYRKQPTHSQYRPNNKDSIEGMLRSESSYRPRSHRTAIYRSSTMSTTTRPEYSIGASRKESGKDIAEFKAFYPPSRTTSKVDCTPPSRKPAYGFGGHKSSPHTVYNQSLRGQTSSVSIRMDESPSQIPPALRPTQLGIVAYAPSQSSTSFRGRLTPSILRGMQPDRDMTPQPTNKLNVPSVNIAGGGRAGRGGGGEGQRIVIKTQGRKVLRILEDSQRRKKSYQGMQQRVLVPAMAEQMGSSVLKKRVEEQQLEWQPRLSQARR